MTDDSLFLSQVCEGDVQPFRAAQWPRHSFIYVDVSAVNASAKVITGSKELAVSEAPSRAQTIVRAGDIIVSNVRPNLNAVAKVDAVHDGAVCSSAFTALRCGPRLLPDYLFCFAQRRNSSSGYAG
jgi:type I restriction enzyme S subunit